MPSRRLFGPRALSFPLWLLLVAASVSLWTAVDGASSPDSDGSQARLDRREGVEAHSVHRNRILIPHFVTVTQTGFSIVTVRSTASLISTSVQDPTNMESTALTPKPASPDQNRSEVTFSSSSNPGDTTPSTVVEEAQPADSSSAEDSSPTPTEAVLSPPSASNQQLDAFESGMGLSVPESTQNSSSALAETTLAPTSTWEQGQDGSEPGATASMAEYVAASISPSTSFNNSTGKQNTSTNLGTPLPPTSSPSTLAETMDKLNFTQASKTSIIDFVSQLTSEVPIDTVGDENCTPAPDDPCVKGSDVVKSLMFQRLVQKAAATTPTYTNEGAGRGNVPSGKTPGNNNTLVDTHRLDSPKQDKGDDLPDWIYPATSLPPFLIAATVAGTAMVAIGPETLKNVPPKDWWKVTRERWRPKTREARWAWNNLANKMAKHLPAEMGESFTEKMTRKTSNMPLRNVNEHGGRGSWHSSGESTGASIDGEPPRDGVGPKPPPEPPAPPKKKKVPKHRCLGYCSEAELKREQERLKAEEAQAKVVAETKAKEKADAKARAKAKGKGKEGSGKRKDKNGTGRGKARSKSGSTPSLSELPGLPKIPGLPPLPGVPNGLPLPSTDSLPDFDFEPGDAAPKIPGLLGGGDLPGFPGLPAGGAPGISLPGGSLPGVPNGGLPGVPGGDPPPSGRPENYELSGELWSPGPGSDESTPGAPTPNSFEISDGLPSVGSDDGRAFIGESPAVGPIQIGAREGSTHDGSKGGGSGPGSPKEESTPKDSQDGFGEWNSNTDTPPNEGPNPDNQEAASNSKAKAAAGQEQTPEAKEHVPGNQGEASMNSAQDPAAPEPEKLQPEEGEGPESDLGASTQFPSSLPSSPHLELRSTPPTPLPPISRRRTRRSLRPLFADLRRRAGLAECQFELDQTRQHLTMTENTLSAANAKLTTANTQLSNLQQQLHSANARISSLTAASGSASIHPEQPLCDSKGTQTPASTPYNVLQQKLTQCTIDLDEAFRRREVLKKTLEHQALPHHNWNADRKACHTANAELSTQLSRANTNLDGFKSDLRTCTEDLKAERDATAELDMKNKDLFRMNQEFGKNNKDIARKLNQWREYGRANVDVNSLERVKADLMHDLSRCREKLRWKDFEAAKKWPVHEHPDALSDSDHVPAPVPPSPPRPETPPSEIPSFPGAKPLTDTQALHRVNADLTERLTQCNSLSASSQGEIATLKAEVAKNKEIMTDACPNMSKDYLQCKKALMEGLEEWGITNGELGDCLDREGRELTEEVGSGEDDEGKGEMDIEGDGLSHRT